MRVDKEQDVGCSSDRKNDGKVVDQKTGWDWWGVAALWFNCTKQEDSVYHKKLHMAQAIV